MLNLVLSRSAILCNSLTLIFINQLLITKAAASEKNFHKFIDINQPEINEELDSQLIKETENKISPIAQEYINNDVNNIPVPEEINPIDQIEFSPTKPEDKDTRQSETESQTNNNLSARKKALDVYILNSIGNTSRKYPWLVRPTDNLGFSPTKFNPLEHSKYVDFDFRSISGKIEINKLMVADFPEKEQFYWVLPNNRIVFETNGTQLGITPQGESSELENRQKVRLSQALWGQQSVFVLPQPLNRLSNQNEVNKYSVQSTFAELTTPEGTQAPRIQIANSSIRRNSSNQLTSSPTIPIVGSASTRNQRGGGALFQNLDVGNTPQLIQAFPTNNLQALFNPNGLFPGSNISQDALNGIGFEWENPVTGKKSQFQPEMTSNPGIKIAQYGKFDNLDLLNVLVNPYLGNNLRDIHYLNSLFWVSLGQRKPEFLDKTETQDNYSWQRFYWSNPRNQTLLQYDKNEVKATYYNIFTNPGLSIYFSPTTMDIDKVQTIHSSLGLILGSLFTGFQPKVIEDSLQEAKKRYQQQANLVKLTPKANSQERKKINQRLNKNLLFSNANSSIYNISGKLTLNSQIRPNNSSIWQITAGNYRRFIQFIQSEPTEWIEGQTYISKIRLSNQDFGKLNFIGTQFPLEKTGINPSNRSTALQVILKDGEEEELVYNWNSSDFTMVPLNINGFDMASDRIELAQEGEIKNKFSLFKGSLLLPALEISLSGTDGNLNYALNSGLWANFDSQSALNVKENSLGLKEPSIGFYLNGLVNIIKPFRHQYKNGKLKSLGSNSYNLKLNFNSYQNGLNPSYINLNHSFYFQNKYHNYGISSGVSIANNGYNLRATGIIQGNLGFKNGLNFSGSLEINPSVAYSLNINGAINRNWKLGAYWKNFYNINEGLNNRIYNLSYGLNFQYNPSSNYLLWKTRLGFSGNNFDLHLEGSLRF